MDESQNVVNRKVAPASADVKEREKLEFFELAERLARTSNRAEQKRLKEELARMTFGEP